MAFGSAAPEIIINAVSTLKALMANDSEDNDDTALGVGAIIGSGMIAFTVIPGVCGLGTKEQLSLKRRPLARDVLAYSIALAILYCAINSGEVNGAYAGAMVGLYVMYMAVVVCSPGVRQLYRVNVLGRAPRASMHFVEQQRSGEQARASPEQPVGSVVPLNAADASSSTMPTVLPTYVTTSDALNLWDALPVGSPMEFSHLDISTSLSSNNTKRTLSSYPAVVLFKKVARRVWAVIDAPLATLLRVTCPECDHECPTAAWYPVTLITSFVWVSLFSTTISAVVSR
ncbi:MAG: hypothetical protein SGPRY_012108, partial [Prymnesium sp.]